MPVESMPRTVNPIRALLLAAFALPQTTRRVARGLEAPQTLHGSLSFEQLLPGNVTFSAVGVSTRIRRMLRSRNINAPVPGTGERPLGRSDTVYQYESTGRFDQEQLILGLNRRSGRGATLFVRYFLGRARSDTDGAGSFPASSYDLAAEYGPSREDIRHRDGAILRRAPQLIVGNRVDDEPSHLGDRVSHPPIPIDHGVP